MTRPPVSAVRGSKDGDKQDAATGAGVLSDARIEDNREWCLNTAGNYHADGWRGSRYHDLALICTELLWLRRFTSQWMSKNAKPAE